MDEATRISLKDQFNSLLVRAIEGRRGGMALMRVLEELDFYNSPASAKHHLNVPGGLVMHSLNVARVALELCDKMPQFAKCNKGAVLTAALLHDVCKAGQYIKKPDGSYCYEDSHLMGHGEASVSIIKDWIFLTDTEALAIRWHMGAYSGEQDWGTLSKVYDRCPEALCLQMLCITQHPGVLERPAHWEGGAKQSFDQGMYKADLLLFVKQKDYGPMPKSGKQITLDKKRIYNIKSCSLKAGMYRMELERVR